MGRAAAGRAEGDTGALEDLEFHWGSAYDIALVDDSGSGAVRERDPASGDRGEVPRRGEGDTPVAAYGVST